MFGAVRHGSTAGNDRLTARAEREMTLPPYSICQVGVTAPTMRTAGLALVEAGPGPGGLVAIRGVFAINEATKIWLANLTP